MFEANILIADDEQQIVAVLQNLLQRHGYKVYGAFNGEDAVEIVKNHSIDAAILDMKMPKMDGIEALREIKHVDPSIEVVILTGYADEESLKEAVVGYGAFDYLLKPFKKDGIIKAVRNALIRRKAHMQKGPYRADDENFLLRLEREFQEKTHQLRVSQIKYKEIIENSNDMIVVTQDGMMKFANRRTYKLTGFDEDEINQLPFVNFAHPEDRKMVFEKNQSLLKDDELPITYSFRIIKKNKEPFWVEINAVRTQWEGSAATLSFIRDISERKQAEKQIRILSQELMKAQESERQRISRDLHDNVAQDLSTLKIDLDTFFDNHRISESEMKQRLSNFSAILQEAIGSIRNLAYDLRPPSLDQFGLMRTVAQYCEDFEKQYGMDIDLYTAGMDELNLGLDKEINLYRLVQESLNNIRKHADAKHVKIRFVASFPNIILRIEDNGKGFNVKERVSKALDEKRMGLSSMEERVRLLQGKMKIQSRLKEGTRILIEVPFAEKKNDPGNRPSYHR